MNTNKNKILDLYFDKKMKQVDIAKLLKISENAVSKTLKGDARFENEKKYRKELNKLKHNKDIQRRVESKRKEKRMYDTQILKKMHNQASLELSGGRKTISDRAFRDWNSSAYEYNRKKDTYILKKELTAGADIAKRIKWKM